jgi:hypothetical protein
MRSKKRNLFAELSEGMTALAEARQGKRTLRTHAVEFNIRLLSSTHDESDLIQHPYDIRERNR